MVWNHPETKEQDHRSKPGYDRRQMVISFWLHGDDDAKGNRGMRELVAFCIENEESDDEANVPLDMDNGDNACPSINADYGYGPMATHRDQDSLNEEGTSPGRGPVMKTITMVLLMERMTSQPTIREHHGQNPSPTREDGQMGVNDLKVENLLEIEVRRNGQIGNPRHGIEIGNDLNKVSMIKVFPVCPKTQLVHRAQEVLPPRQYRFSHKRQTRQHFLRQTRQQ